MYRRSVRHGSESVTSRKTSPRSPFPCARSRGLARHGAAMARHERPSSPAPTTRPVGFSRIRKHETRITAFILPRDTKHGMYRRSVRHGSESVTSRKTYAGPPFPCARSRGLARHGAAMARHGRPSSPAPATRPVGFSRIRKHETRNTIFPVPAAIPRRATPSPANRFSRITRHETRITAFILPPATRHESRFLFFHETRNPECIAVRFAMGAIASHHEKPTPGHRFPAPVRVALRGMARLWRGMGGRRPPHRQHGLLGFLESGNTRHETRFSPSLRPLQGEQPQARPTGFHETRITNHETRLLSFPTHHFPPFPTISRHFPAIFGPPHPPTDQWSARRPPFWMGLTKSAVRWKSHQNAQNPGSHRKMREVQYSPRSRCGERRMNPCRERRTFRIAQARERPMLR